MFVWVTHEVKHYHIT